LQYHVLLDYPSDEDIRALLQKHLANLPVDPSVDMTDVNVIVSGSPVVKATGATIESFCNQLRLVTLRDAISNISNGQVEPDDSELKGPVVTQRHFDEVLKNMFLRSEDFE
jgi:SpoVK/Ycf46/Vps4 family AAA+-type ATPase